jgi:hypothetical protein
MKTKTVRYEIPGAWWTEEEPIEEQAWHDGTMSAEVRETFKRANISEQEEPEGQAEWFDERAGEWHDMDLELDRELAEREQDQYEAAKQRGETGNP